METIYDGTDMEALSNSATFPGAPCSAGRGDATDFAPHVASFGGIHCAINLDMANLSMVQVDGGYVAVDAGSTPANAQRVAQQWRERAGGPIQALIYTHSHLDHIGGASGFDLDGIPIWGQARFLHELSDTQLLNAGYYTRGAKQFGFLLAESELVSNGIGPALAMGAEASPPLCMPTHSFDDKTEVDIAGKTFVLRSAPGETYDHLYIWLPDDRALFVGDNLYQAFPNLYSIRGVPPRPVRSWIESLDEMRRLRPRPELMVLGHTQPVEGADRIYQLLTDYRDAIAFVHDSVVRGINAGKTPGELVREIRLPPHLDRHPYLREHYGTLAGSIRGIYAGYMGWFDGDAANLEPIANDEVAHWMVEELGSRRAILERIERSLAAGDLRRALWLSQILQADDAESRDGRLAKADVLERLAAQCHNPLMRNWQRSEAALLRGSADLPMKPKITGATIQYLPLKTILGLLPSRLHPKNSARVNMTIGFDITDTQEQYTLFVRRGVGELSTGMCESCCLTVRATEADLKRIFIAGDVLPNRREFWQRIEFVVPEKGVLKPIQKLFRLARVNRLFIRP